MFVGGGTDSMKRGFDSMLEGLCITEDRRYMRVGTESMIGEAMDSIQG